MAPAACGEGTPNRNYCTRDLAASTVFVALYVGAVEGVRRYLGPVHVYRMSGKQAARSGSGEREAYAKNVVNKKHKVPGARWYADNTREPIRDETLRDGLVAVGAVLRREDLPTTSGLPKYALKSAFAALFDPALDGAVLERAIRTFQTMHLSKGALARVSILLSGAPDTKGGIAVALPSGESRMLAPGPSSIIAQAVIQEFAGRFLEKPAVLWLSESGSKVVARDDKLAAAVGLKIEPDKHLPDLILADLGPADPLIVFIEVVATDGAITSRRQEAIHALTDAAGFKREQIVCVSAYRDRDSSGFKKTVSSLAWNSFAWFASEPGNILVLRDGGVSAAKLSAIVHLG